MIKRLLISLSVLLAITISLSAQTNPGDSFNYNNIIYQTTSVNSAQKIALVVVRKPSNGAYAATTLTIPAKFVSSGWEYRVYNFTSDAFTGCSCKEIEFDVNLDLSYISKDAFKGCSKLETITLPSSIQSIGESAFEGCTALTTINLNSTIYSIGAKAFYQCSSLKVLPESNFNLTEVPEYAFALCSSLERFVSPYNVKKIGHHAFLQCEKMITAYIGSATESIGNYAFAYCSSLVNMYNYAASPPKTGVGAFYKCGFTDMHVINGTKILYDGVSPWNTYNIIEDLSEPGTVPCDEPVITINGKKLTITSETKGATCWYVLEPITTKTIGSIDGKNSSTVTMNYPTEIKLTCFATCPGYNTSNVVTRKLNLNDLVSGNGDVNGDGEINISDITYLVNKILGK